MSRRFDLKAATDDIHQELDEALSRLNLGDPADYARFLAIHARAVPSIETALIDGGVAALIDGWGSERRSDAIMADLAALGYAMPEPADAPEIRGSSELLGAAYVFEGSRLGGQVLRRRVGEGLPVSYLSQSRSTDPWAAVVAALDRLIYSDAEFGEATDAARRCFTLFLSAAREAVTQ